MHTLDEGLLEWGASFPKGEHKEQMESQKFRGEIPNLDLTIDSTQGRDGFIDDPYIPRDQGYHPLPRRESARQARMQSSTQGTSWLCKTIRCLIESRLGPRQSDFSAPTHGHWCWRRTRTPSQEQDVIIAYRSPLALVRGMMSMTLTSVHAITGIQSVRKKNMNSGSISGKAYLRENNTSWMNGKITSQICLKCDRKTSHLCSCPP